MNSTFVVVCVKKGEGEEGEGRHVAYLDTVLLSPPQVLISVRIADQC